MLFARALARNLILGYFHTPSAKKQEVLKIIASALDFSGEELQQVCRDEGGQQFK